MVEINDMICLDIRITSTCVTKKKKESSKDILSLPTRHGDPPT